VNTVAETIVAHLTASGVRRVYGVPGDGRGEELVELARENVKRLV
jgi:hypothetical protein